MTDRYRPELLHHLAQILRGLREDALRVENDFRAELDAVAPAYRDSAANLLHYLAIRKHDVRELQSNLHRLGLSSLGRMEAYVLATIDAVLAALARLSDEEIDVPKAPAAVDFDRGRALLVEHTNALFGPPPPERDVRIMVTMPSEAAEDAELLENLLDAGMNVMRINCAKDDRDAWDRMIDNLRRGEEATGKRSRVLMDLAGPNPRTAGVEETFRLIVGDTLDVFAGDVPACPPRRDIHAETIEPARVSCTLPEVLRDVQVGHRFYYDDGGLAGFVVAVEDDHFTVEITRARKGSVKIKSDKGINLPDTRLQLPALTEKDRADLDFIIERADMIGLSFVRSTGDVGELVDELESRQASELGLVLKIETQVAFEELPQLLLTAMRHPPVGVMVARGDMGVELGFDRMAEVQEEILWICEAAHLPGIWATQVLEHLSKEGLPSRAEVTDAAMSGRAECVMLNKGKHVVQTVQFLGDVLRRMQSHQHKKLSMLRKLSISQRL